MNVIAKKPFINGLVEGSIDAQVYQDVLRTYAKETISFLDYGLLGITQTNPKTIARVELTECEISPFRKYEIDCSDVEPSPVNRKSSLQRFIKKKMPFADIQRLLVHSFSPNAEGHRPYPSAGGLYPVEPLVFLFSEHIESKESLISGCYHFRPVSKTLQCLQKISTHDFFTTLLHNYFDSEKRPCFGILYLAHIGKAIFKYRYRGYRHALMEAGSMYQKAVVTSEAMGLRNTVWSTFSEHELLYALDLDFGTYMPLTMQFFGYGE